MTDSAKSQDLKLAVKKNCDAVSCLVQKIKTRKDEILGSRNINHKVSAGFSA